MLRDLLITPDWATTSPGSWSGSVQSSSRNRFASSILKDDYLVRLARSLPGAILVSGDRDLLEADIRDSEVLTPRALIDRIGLPHT